MRDVDRGDAELAHEHADLDAKLLPQRSVEVRERLVEEEHARPAHDRAAHRDALALAARELRREAIHQPPELEELGRLVAPLLSLGGRRPSAS